MMSSVLFFAYFTFYFRLEYRIYSNKRRDTCLIFHTTSVALIRGRCLFRHCTRQIYFFYIFIQRYTFSLLIFLWTDTKLIVNLELREKFTRERKISVVKASGVWHLFEGSTYLSIYGISRSNPDIFKWLNSVFNISLNSR